MSEYTKINVHGTTLAITAIPNGRVRYPVGAYRATDLQKPIAIDDINLSSEKDRNRFLADLPSESQAEASAMLLCLATDVLAARLELGKRVPNSGTGPVADESWPLPVDGIVLLDGLTALLAQYIILPPHADVAIALWLIHTYLFETADYTPYLWVNSPARECGKSTLLELLQRLAYRAKMTGGVSGAALYRWIDRDRPTVLLDELHTRLHGDSGESLRGVLNTGFSRSGSIMICAGDDHVPTEFKTFSAKVLAGIGRLWDTVASRSIPIRLRRATKTELGMLTKIRGNRIEGVCQPYRRQLIALADTIRDEVTDKDPDTPDDLTARQTDVWGPLLAIADAVGGSWPVRARAAAVALHAGAADEGDVGLLLLEDVRQPFQDGFAVDGKLTSAKIVEELVKREDRPWPEYNRGQPITKSGVARLLGRFGAKPKNMRVEHGTSSPVVKGYDYDDLASSFLTYISIPEIGATSATSAASPGAEAVAAVADDSGVASDCLVAPDSDEEKALLARLEREANC